MRQQQYLHLLIGGGDAAWNLSLNWSRSWILEEPAAESATLRLKLAKSPPFIFSRSWNVASSCLTLQVDQYAPILEFRGVSHRASRLRVNHVVKFVAAFCFQIMKQVPILSGEIWEASSEVWMILSMKPISCLGGIINGGNGTFSLLSVCVSSQYWKFVALRSFQWSSLLLVQIVYHNWHWSQVPFWRDNHHQSERKVQI